MLDETLAQLPGVRGLYGEVVECDTYRLRHLPFHPDVVFDLGANVGLFARYVRSLFPLAHIVCVEPYPENFANLVKYTPAIYAPVTLLNAIIGRDPVYEYVNPPDGAHACYISTGDGLGYREELMAIDHHLVRRTDMLVLRLDQLFASHWRPGQRAVLKIDIEGGESAIFAHPDSVQALCQADYVAIEFHGYGQRPELLAEVRDTAEAAFAQLAVTHDCWREHTMVFALRKGLEPGRLTLEDCRDRRDIYRRLGHFGYPGPAAEVGVATGVNAASMLQLWPSLNKLYLVDLWRPQSPEVYQDDCNGSPEAMAALLEECRSRMVPYPSRHVPLQLDSVAAARQLTAEGVRFDFVYLDANHGYDAVANDLAAWYPLVRAGGVLAGHDYHPKTPGVIRAVDEFAKQHNLQLYLPGQVGGDCSWAFICPAPLAS